MSEEPTEAPEHEKPDHPHGQPPGQDPGWVPPGHGGTPPGHDKPDEPGVPTHPDVPPPGTPTHPDVPPPIGPTHPIEEPDDVPDPQPEHPTQEPGDEPVPTPHAEAEVEPYLGFDEFVATLPEFRGMSIASAKATEAALNRWMRKQGHAASGHYPREQWQEYFTQAMAHS